MASKSQNRHLLAPESLKLGASVAVIRPASRLDEMAYQETVRVIRKSGFFVAEYPGKMSPDRFFAGSDLDRAKELDWAMSQPGIAAVFCARGGYGSQRMIDSLHSQSLKSWHPKMVVGYSDITFLLQWIQNSLGWTTFHGPLIGQMKEADLLFFLEQMMALSKENCSLGLKSQNHIGRNKSNVRGRLVGGNLSLLQVAGAAALPREPLILCIEDVNEDYRRIDRMIWNLIGAGYDQWVKGILVGTLVNCGKSDHKIFKKEVVLNSLRRLCSGPIVTGLRFGHGLKRQVILPMGALASLGASRLTIESAVVRADS